MQTLQHQQQQQKKTTRPIVSWSPQVSLSHLHVFFFIFVYLFLSFKLFSNEMNDFVLQEDDILREQIRIHGTDKYNFICPSYVFLESYRWYSYLKVPFVSRDFNDRWERDSNTFLFIISFLLTKWPLSLSNLCLAFFYFSWIISIFICFWMCFACSWAIIASNFTDKTTRQCRRRFFFTDFNSVFFFFCTVWFILISCYLFYFENMCRWFTYLNSDFKKGGWSPEEDILLCEVYYHATLFTT